MESNKPMLLSSFTVGWVALATNVTTDGVVVVVVVVVVVAVAVVIFNSQPAIGLASATAAPPGGLAFILTVLQLGFLESKSKMAFEFKAKYLLTARLMRLYCNAIDSAFVLL